ncbi:hypothetical protein ACIBMZ_29610 [Micromonospora sp. NPDC049900]|uniref:hypothetical protein n=1 Tax=Micromonospora sp. NPDC049900 TaxID=3364275 RepID=UPI0037B909C4
MTTLEQRRPAYDMLEDLPSDIRGRRLAYHEYAESPADEADYGMSDDDLDDGDRRCLLRCRTRASADRHRLDLEPSEPQS